MQYINKNKRKSRFFLRFFFILILLLIISLPFILRLLWHITETRELNIFILDKTVINQQYQEHISFNWVLKNEKYVKPDGEFYLPGKDYFGFFPDGDGGYSFKDLEKKDSTDLYRLAENYDMAYYTDLYGVYYAEWISEYPHLAPEEELTPGERSRLIYGGMTQNDLDFLKLMKEQNKLIINEFNIIASPTSHNIRKQYEEEFNISWTGWVGRYFEDLDTVTNKELPPWLVNNYIRDNNNDWPFSKSGIALVSNDGKVVILEDQTHLNHEVPVIVTSDYYADHYNVAKQVKYPFWFDICVSGDENEVVSYYEIDVNSVGDSIVSQWNIPEKFPAVIRHKDAYTYYYFAGDFADNPISLNTVKFKHVHNFSFLFYTSEIIERDSFFWRFYRPILIKILDEYYNNLQKK